MSAEFINCWKWLLLAPDDFVLLTNQTLVHKPTNISYSPSDYQSVSPHSAVVCIPDQVHPSLFFLDYVGVFVRCLSLFALLVSIAVDLWVVREIRGKGVNPIICHKLSLIAFYASMCVWNASLCGHDSLASDVVVAFCLYSARVAYCWINVISIDMLQTFHPSGVVRRSSIVLIAGSLSLPRFALQGLYALGLPAFLVGLDLLFGQLPIPVLDAWKHSGPLYGNLVQVIFMSTSVSIIVLVNAVFCVLIINNLRRIRQNADHQALQIDGHNELFHVYLKLVMVSGFLYVLQLAQYIAAHYGQFNPFWLLPDWLANSQGVWLFLIYSCNSSIRSATAKKIKQRFEQRNVNINLNFLLLAFYAVETKTDSRRPTKKRNNSTDLF